MNENMNMKRRARVRAKKVVQGWIAGVRSQNATALAEVQREVVIGDKTTRGVRKRLGYDRSLEMAGTAWGTSFVGFKKRRSQEEQWKTAEAEGEAESESGDRLEEAYEDWVE